MPDSRLMDVMLFNYGTSNLTDFRYREMKPIVRTVRTVNIEKPGCLRIRPPPLKDINTLSDWKNLVPSDLFVKPKEIVRTNPKQIQEKYEDLPDLGKDEAQKTRPRLVMTPAVSLDEITDPQSRKQLIENVYKSTMQEAYSDVASTSGNLKAPFSGLPAPANPITLERLNFPYLSPEWRMQAAGWDVAQLRGRCDLSRKFYLARAPPQCDACKVTTAVIAHRKLMKEMKKR